MTIWRWWRDWRERRTALRFVRQAQRADEATLMDQNLNPLNMAKMSLDRNDPASAATHWERARVMVPDVVLRSEASLDILLGLNRYDEAEALMHQREASMPRDRFPAIGLARIAEQRGPVTEALARWEAARDRTRDYSEGYLGCARCLIQLGRVEEAERQLAAAARRTDDKVPALVGLARISDANQNWPESLERWRQLAVDHQFPAAFAYHAKALIELGRIDEAEAWLEEPAQIYPRDLEIGVTWARLASERGDPATAVNRWASVRRMEPRLQIGYREGARWLAATGRHDEADVIMRDAMARFPDEDWPLRDFARLAFDRQEWNEAAARWMTVCERFPDDQSARDFAEAALRAAGREEDAASIRHG